MSGNGGLHLQSMAYQANQAIYEKLPKWDYFHSFKKDFFSLFSFKSNLFFKIMKPLSLEALSLLLIQIQIQAVCNGSYLLHYIPI